MKKQASHEHDFIETLKTIMFNTPETSETKIPFITEELLAGRYQIDSRKIASKLTEHTTLIESDLCEMA